LGFKEIDAKRLLAEVFRGDRVVLQWKQQRRLTSDNLNAQVTSLKDIGMIDDKVIISRTSPNNCEIINHRFQIGS